MLSGKSVENLLVFKETVTIAEIEEASCYLSK